MLRILLLSTLFPSSARPAHGIFVESRLRELVKSGEVEAKAVVPVPWFPFRGDVFGKYGRMAATALREVRNGIEVRYPRYFLLPKVGMEMAPRAVAGAALCAARELQHEGFDFDLIDAHYYYPDGVAAGIVASELGKPFVVTARGTDLNLFPQFPGPRRRILETAARASASIGVSRALMDRLAEIGADPSKLHVFRNGIDLERFRPMSRSEARDRLAIPAASRVLLSVGHLVELKGHHLAIEALANLPEDVMLIIAGEGEERPRLEALARALQVAGRVRLAGAVPHAELPWYYAAADALVLCSSREGMPNVLLESMACGTPAIATAVGGIPEVISSPQAGMLMPERTSEALARCVSAMLDEPPDRALVRRHAEGFGWDQTTRNQIALFRDILHRMRGQRDGKAYS